MKNPKISKRRNNLCDTLPDELTVEILKRLPVKSLLRFRCVCKSWLSQISAPEFAKSHFDLAAAPAYRLLRRLYSALCSIGIDESLDFAAVYMHPSPPCPRKCLVDDVEILGSCRGFLLLSYERGKRGYLYLWNPSTTSRKQLPGRFPDLIPQRICQCGFGYDASTNDYLIILIGLQEPSSWICYFSVKTNSWKPVVGVNLPYKDMGFRVGSPLNGALHWLVFSYDKNVPVIIAFDLKEKTLSDIPLPHDLTVESKYELHCLRVMGGYLCLWCSAQGCATDEIWVMKEYKVESSWTLSFVLPGSFFPTCITKDGGILGSGINGRLEKHNEKGELLEHLVYGQPLESCTSNLQPSIYIESLLSLPQVSLEETSEDGQQQ